MIYPLTERRIPGFDRRSNSSSTGNSLQAKATSDYESDKEQRHGGDRRQITLNREKLLDSIAARQGKSRWIDYLINFIKSFHVLFIPLVIAVSSGYVTKQVNDQQRESAELIAKANRENSTKIADAKMETQRLMEMAEIFSKIITLLSKPPENYKETEGALKRQVKSLSVFGDESLPYLIQLRDEYKRKNYQDKPMEEISKIAANTIKGILLLNQPEVKMDFLGKEELPLELPRRKYINYNLSKSRFEYVNLYEADFSRSSLQKTKFIFSNLSKANFSNASLIDAEFTDTDLSGSNFTDANLLGATFKLATLTNVSFENAFIPGVRFVDCINIDKAKFSMETLLQADVEPMESLPAGSYLQLLMQHEDDLESTHKEDTSRLKKVYDKLNIANFDSLQVKFDELQEEKYKKNFEDTALFAAGFSLKKIFDGLVESAR